MLMRVLGRPDFPIVDLSIRHELTDRPLFRLLQITKLKIDSNPFAKGFRDSSRLTDFER